MDQFVFRGPLLPDSVISRPTPFLCKPAPRPATGIENAGAGAVVAGENRVGRLNTPQS